MNRFNKLLKLEESERRTIIIQARSNSGSKRTIPLENRLEVDAKLHYYF